MNKIQATDQISLIYNRLYEIGKSINETLEINELYDIACDFATNELNFEKAIIFEHDDTNGWFKVANSKGYETDIEKRILNIITLLLSGEVIEYLRVEGKPIIQTKTNPQIQVQSLSKSLFLSEAYFELFGGDKDIPYGLIVVGNGIGDTTNYSHLIQDSFIMMALGNFTVQLSNTINNIVFYKAWQREKEMLEENIVKRTKELEEQKSKFEAIYKTSKDGIAILDFKTTNFLDVNPAYCEMTGFTREELLQTSCLALTIPEEIEASKKAMEEVKQKGFITNFLKYCSIKDDERIIVNMSLSLMDDKTKILVSSKDITKQKELELELQTMNIQLEARVKEEVEKNRKNEFQLLEQSKNASMGQMIGNIAHQWRQPLSAITSLASSLQINNALNIIDEGEIDLKMIDIIEKANYLSTTIDTFRNFLKQTNEEKEFSLEKMIKNAKQIVDASLKSSNVNIIDNIDYEKTSSIIGIESEISQVIINILNNAKDILKEKEIEQAWVQINLSKNKTKHILTIEDNGGGIPDDVLPKIFDPYFTTKHQSQGTGLGLHMSYRIITESFQGQIYANNTKNGALFTIELPVIK